MAINKFLLSRRHALISIAGFTGGLILTSCGNKEDYETLSLGARFADGYQAPTVFTSGSPQRAPYVLISEQGWPLSEEVPDAIELIVTEINSEETIFEGKVHRHGEPGVIPYFPLIFDPPRSGEYKVEGRGMDGHHQLIVTDPSDIQLIQIGQKMPSIQTPTMQNNLEINPICTKSSGPCSLHKKSLDESLSSSTPTALLVSTPRFCQTDVCGPALDILIKQSELLDGKLSIIHAEVFKEPEKQNFSVAPVVGAFGLTFEPSLIVANSEGVITSILHFAMDTKEVSEALSTVL
ncbi:MAG: hypothetical protein MK195_00725 [Acidimicrobiales bacterium]|nr:hypothetical protein [Acidimicrobiales bacterium]